MYVLCVFVCSWAAQHKDVQSFNGACLVKMTQFLARCAHVCLCFNFVCVCFSPCSILQRYPSSVGMCVVNLNHVLAGNECVWICCVCLFVCV